MAKKKTRKYLHGYTREEQERLYRQARFLENNVHGKIDFSKQNRIVEVGCGVGAQTEILLERFPHLKISGIDASSEQIQQARKRLRKAIAEKRVDLRVGDAAHLPYKDDSFDGAFVCWFLEHVQGPIDILREIRRTLRPGAVIYCSEVQNATLFLHPYSPATLKYWFEFNDYQWSIHGDPFIGAKLANYLLAAGYQNVTTDIKVEFYDNRTPKRRAEFIEYWTSLLQSGAPGLIRAGRVTPELVEEMTAELGRLKDDPDAVFYYSWIQARAEAF